MMIKYDTTNKKIIVILFIFTLFLNSCKKKIDTTRKENHISVLVAVPIRQSLDEYLELSAEIKAIKEVEISSDVPGKIANILKYEGSFVKKGETIALIDRFVIGANYAYAPARTPITGYVTTTYMAVGSSILAGTPIANVADISQLEVEIQVPERSITGIELGQKVIIRVPSAPNKEVNAAITKRDYAVNPSTRTLTVKALVNNKDEMLLPGMFSDVQILLNSANNVFVIPNSAIFNDDLGKSYIYVVKEDNSNTPPTEGQIISTNNKYRAYTREVNILFTSKDKVALSSGLEDGEEVVMFGREFLRNGALVNRIENDPTILEYITPKETFTTSQTNDLEKTQQPIVNNEKKENYKTTHIKITNNSPKQNTITNNTKSIVNNLGETNNSTNTKTNENNEIYSIGGGQ